MRSTLNRLVGRRRVALQISAKSNPFREGNSSSSGSNGGKGSDKKKSDASGGRAAKQPPKSSLPAAPSTSKKSNIKPKEKPVLTISSPLEITLLEQGETEPAEEPKWGTFCNHLDGEWIGQYAAYTPWEVSPIGIFIPRHILLGI
jgi:hypothetical protein